MDYCNFIFFFNDTATTEIYTEWINNDRHARALLANMREIAAKAAELILQEDGRG